MQPFFAAQGLQGLQPRFLAAQESQGLQPFLAAQGLHGFCGKKIIADGLLIKNPKIPLFALQFKKLVPDGKWSRANQFGKDWSKANGGKAAGQWFKNDKTIKKIIAEQGVFGIPPIRI